MRAKIILVIPAETTMKHSNVKGMNSLKNVQKESTGYEIPKNLEFFNLIQEQIKPPPNWPKTAIPTIKD